MGSLLYSLYSLFGGWGKSARFRCGILLLGAVELGHFHPLVLVKSDSPLLVDERWGWGCCTGALKLLWSPLELCWPAAGPWVLWTLLVCCSLERSGWHWTLAELEPGWLELGWLELGWLEL